MPAQTDEGLTAAFPLLSLTRNQSFAICNSVCKQSLALKIWELEPLLAYPLQILMCKQHSETAIMALFDDRKGFCLAVENAKAKFAEYLRTFALISVELRACTAGKDTTGEPSDTVRLHRQVDFREPCLTSFQVAFYWPLRRDIEQTVFGAVLRAESFRNFVPINGQFCQVHSYFETQCNVISCWPRAPQTRIVLKKILL